MKLWVIAAIAVVVVLAQAVALGREAERARDLQARLGQAERSIVSAKEAQAAVAAELQAARNAALQRQQARPTIVREEVQIDPALGDCLSYTLPDRLLREP